MFRKSFYNTFLYVFSYILCSDGLMSNKEMPKIIFEHSLLFSGSTYRIAIPREIIRALDLEKGDTLQVTLEGRKIVIWKKEE
ncbi:MAG: AbrB/MazE/SpoVT family DNA-binding domain-containing protein [Candidatus Heimdallarchaeota archaeon]|nr:AbrB/MazE/SpoVT family DNA-binding domain-containing protein [Candidatus Heimdallarchaeota archaeon]